MEQPIVNVTATGTTRDYDAQYKIKVLKANIPFTEQVTDESTKYIIRWNFDLGGEEVEIPANCILQFDGGSLSNGRVNLNNNIKIIGGVFTDVMIDIMGSNIVIDSIESINNNISYKNIRTDYTLDGNGKISNIEIINSKFKTTVDTNTVHIASGSLLLVNNVIFKNNIVEFNRIGFVTASNDNGGPSSASDVCKNVLIEGNTITYIGENLPQYGFPLSIEEGCTDVKICNNTLRGGLTGIELPGPKNITIANNTISVIGSSRGRTMGIYCSEGNYVGDAWCGDLIITGNYISSEDTINLSNNNCAIRGTRRFENVIITNNVFKRCLYLDSQDASGLSPKVTITDNVIDVSDIDDNGIFINGHNNATIKNNKIITHNKVGLRATNCKIGIGGNIYENDLTDSANRGSATWISKDDNTKLIYDGFERNGVFLSIYNLDVLTTDNYHFYNGSTVYRLIMVEDVDIASNSFTLASPILVHLCGRFYNSSDKVKSIDFSNLKIPCRLDEIVDRESVSYNNIAAGTQVLSERYTILTWDGAKWDEYDGAKYLTTRVGDTLNRPAAGEIYDGFSYLNIETGKKEVFGTKRDRTALFERLVSGNTTEIVNNPLSNGERYSIFRTSKLNIFGFSKVADNPTDNDILLVNNSITPNSYVDGLIAPDPSVYPYLYIKNNSGSNSYYRLYNAPLAWLDPDGASAAVARSGTFANKPSSSDIYTGFAYFCTDKQTTEGATNGIMIYHKGSDIWVDALGRVVS